MAGLLISLEGPEGAGKSVQARLLARRLADLEPVLVREPGDTWLGETVREMLLNPGGGLAAEAEMHLFLAARAQLVAEVIGPALAQDRLVIADRYQDSTAAYQGGGRGVEVAWPPAFPRPRITFLLDLPVEEGRRRQRAAGKRADRLELEPLEFHHSVMAAYRRLAAAEPDRWVVLDATLPPDDVHQQVMAHLAPLIEGALR